MKQIYTEPKVKLLMSNETIQDALKSLVEVPKMVIIKQIRKPFKNESTGETTQKVHAVSGTSLADMIEVDFTLVDQSLDGENAINKTYRIVEYSLNLQANMRGGNFNGYSATGLKLLVTKIEEVKTGGKQ